MRKIIINARFLSQNITGVQRYAIEIAVRIKMLGMLDVEFVSPKNILHKKLSEKLNVKIIGNLTGYLWEQYELPRYLKSQGNPLLLNLGNTAPLFYNPKIVTIYDLSFIYNPKWFTKRFVLLYKFMIPMIIRSSKHIITDSKFIAEEIKNTYGITGNNISVIYGSYSDIFRPTSIDDTSNSNYVLGVGSIDPRKNISAIIDVFKNQSSIEVIIVGERNRVFSSLKVAEIPENIKFTGYISDERLVSLYSGATLFLYPSFYEGFGLPPLEAQACLCPCIVSNVSSLPEIYGDSVIYCDPNSIDDIKAKVLYVFNNEGLRNQLKLKGIKNTKRFSWERSAMKYINLLEKYR